MILQNLNKILLSETKLLTKKRLESLEKLNINSVRDMLLYKPIRYEDRNLHYSVGINTESPVKACAIVTILSHTYNHNINGYITFAKNNESGDTFSLVGFHNRFQNKILKIGKTYHVYGMFIKKDNYISVTGYKTREYDNTFVDEGIMPIYRKVNKFTDLEIFKCFNIIYDAYKDQIEDPVFDNKEHLSELLYHIHLKDLIYNIHVPKREDLQLNGFLNHTCPTRMMMAYHELFYFKCKLATFNKHLKNEKRYSYQTTDVNYIDSYKSMLKYELTNAQKRVIGEIQDDMNSDKFMNRLVQGDVGCGKTEVAFFSALYAMQSGYQACLLAPTNVLALQHYTKMKPICDALGISVCLLTNATVTAMTAENKRNLFSSIASGAYQFIIGTHSIFSDDVSYKNLHLAIIDEQHKFGVDQRNKLIDKGSGAIDVLSLSATPIPRSLALMQFGNLNISIIDELPGNRIPANVALINKSSKKQMFDVVAENLNRGLQVFVVCPFIENNEKMSDVDSIEKIYEEYIIRFKCNIDCLHGSVDKDEQQRILTRFSNNETKILIATTIIEVGIDFPNANTIIIESANRFGYSQLWQLVGRVKRGSNVPYAFIVNNSDEVNDRLIQFCQCKNGFEIAELDLKERGIGTIFGTEQSGNNEFSFSNFATDAKILEKAEKLSKKYPVDFDLDLVSLN